LNGKGGEKEKKGPRDQKEYAGHVEQNGIYVDPPLAKDSDRRETGYLGTKGFEALGPLFGERGKKDKSSSSDKEMHGEKGLLYHW